MKNCKLVMRLFKDTYAVCRLTHNDNIPVWADIDGFCSVTRTSDELSVVCMEKSVPDEIQCEKSWRILKVEGPLDFSLIGILSSISTVLAEKCISIFAISTYDTDYILVKEKDIEKAVDALMNAGYEVRSVE